MEQRERPSAHFACPSTPPDPFLLFYNPGRGPRGSTFPGVEDYPSCRRRPLLLLSATLADPIRDELAKLSIAVVAARSSTPVNEGYARTFPVVFVRARLHGASLIPRTSLLSGQIQAAM